MHLNVYLECINLFANIVITYVLTNWEHIYLTVHNEGNVCVKCFFLHEIVYVEIKMPPMHGLAQWLVGM